MKILTLNNSEVEKSCILLSEKIHSAGFNPDLVIGIKNGGYNLAEVFVRVNPDKNYLLKGCKITRPLSKLKKKIIHKSISFLPIKILDFLRILEANLTFKRKSRKKIEKIEIQPLMGHYRNILIIDDAVDSGATLNIVYNKVKEYTSNCNIKTAVITVTSCNPSFMPDFYLFNNSTLVRFPWSIDAIKK